MARPRLTLVSLLVLIALLVALLPPVAAATPDDRFGYGGAPDDTIHVD